MKSLHHATLIRVNSVRNFSLNDIPEDNEVIDEVIDKFGIGEARGLLTRAYLSPANGVVQVLVTRTDFITHEAQNALLKLLEEPPSSTRLVFVVPKDFIALPTLSSRLNEESEVLADGVENNLFKEFVESSYKNRIARIEESAKKKDVSWQQEIKQGLTDYLSKSSVKTESYKELELVVRLLMTRGASNKMLLEQAALCLPVR